MNRLIKLLGIPLSFSCPLLALPDGSTPSPISQVFHLFEMPAMGYAGYLPFGLECALIIDLIME